MMRRPMSRASDVSQALATLQARWGAAAPRRWGDAGPRVEGALAIAPLPVDDETEAEAAQAETHLLDAAAHPLTHPATPPANPFAPARPGVPAHEDGRVVPTGFA